MRKSWAKWLFSPPVRLRAIPDRWVPLFRLLWFLAFCLSLAAVVLGTVHAIRETYQIRPVFRALALDYDLEDSGRISIQAESRPGETFHLRAIDDTPVPADIRTPDLGRRLEAARGPVVTLDLRDAGGKLVTLHQKRDLAPAPKSVVQSRDLRFAARLTSGLFACGALLLCSVLLARRRPSDPVAMLFAFAFADLAATIDPPLSMWMAYGWPPAYDVISSIWFYLLLIALAVFPDGIFVPKSYRWLVIAAVPLAIFVSLRNVNSELQALLGIGSLLAAVAAQIRRYRRLKSGIERQQIKWAAFGFTAGLLLLAAAFSLLPFLPNDPNQTNFVLNMVVVLLFSSGMAALPLGLLIALTRFRLWEADTVITRSAAYAVVTIIVGIVWAASSDLVKLVIEEVMGRESQAGATTAGAVIAAGIFSPTQSLVLGWTRKRFGGPLDRMRGASAKMKKWALTETPSEVATRALSIIDDVMHPSACAIVLDTALSRELVAARNTESADDPELIEHLTLADEESSVGTLLLGRRSDRNRYSRQQLEAIQEMIPPLAEALRIARSHHSRESTMQQRLDEMAARLAQLEGGNPKPEPA
ncbi:MAG TPA: hypothetical protein VFM42_08470 [Sphingomicrobium sp.]|nr:hypothetical protein [Sphingomicrobium sp.]